MDKLRSMEVFVGVADAGSFTAAARAFDLSVVMVGKHIAELEQRLGARLLNRTTRRQSLTEIGEQYCEQCRQILAHVQSAESGALAMRSGARGNLRISAPVAFGSALLAPRLPIYMAAHPEVSVDLELSERISDVVEEGLDAAIRIGRLEDSSMIARPLKPYGMVICAAPAYLAQYGAPATPADLARHQCLDFLHWRRVVRWKLDAQAAPQPSRFRSNNGQALKQMALNGFGLAMLAEIVVAEEIADGRLVPLLSDYLPPLRPLHLIYPRGRQATPKQRSFVDFVVEHFGLS
ncbi:MULTISPECIES: LysR family transcriptional regulator [unclassified Duganella]|jgi:DNA-binding transcriptional LysR family regulator|uniref:LysR family transcriptional regulator n=1 Tax=unclassified Duganella TaxID=2636909 RepID=UPI00088BAB2A|nr:MULTISPECIES: LysR family transcriptional regulator [unclassified Duganella]SDF70782.1 DNA-binding transcriptional regulator, LysR family [Duganella sp. OV458]SDI58548.1 transcriptional regulator, LysR family [Duganella sp. OV510]